jgi:hypothetical protein
MAGLQALALLRNHFGQLGLEVVARGGILFPVAGHRDGERCRARAQGVTRAQRQRGDDRQPGRTGTGKHKGLGLHAGVAACT